MRYSVSSSFSSDSTLLTLLLLLLFDISKSFETLSIFGGCFILGLVAINGISELGMEDKYNEKVISLSSKASEYGIELEY